MSEKTDWLSTEFTERTCSLDVVYASGARHDLKKLAAYCKKRLGDRCSLIRIYEGNERNAIWERFDGEWIEVSDLTIWRAAHANSKSGGSS
jgi:hypothetical protein